MNLAELILSAMRRERPHLSYDMLAQRALRRGKQVSPTYLHKLVTYPLAGLRANTLQVVAAAVAPTEDEVPLYELIVLAACMRSWGYYVQPVSVDDGVSVVISTSGLTPDQAREVKRGADEAIRRMKANPHVPTGNRVTARPVPPVFSSGVSSPRWRTHDCGGSSHAICGQS